MTDTWGDDDDNDEWDVEDDDEIDARLGLKKGTAPAAEVPTFDDEEDLAIKEREEQEKNQTVELKKKGNALAAKKKAEQERLEELELARKAMEFENEQEASLSPEEMRAMKQRQVEEADHALTDDLFGATDAQVGPGSGGGAAAGAGDKVVMKDIKDHLKHARRVAESFKAHGNIHLVTAFFNECFQGSKDLLDDAATTELIKTLNVIKNEKVLQAKRKVKGQAQKAKKVDKVAEAKARKIQEETFGKNDKYDKYDVVGEDYEDAFF